MKKDINSLRNREDEELFELQWQMSAFNKLEVPKKQKMKPSDLDYSGKKMLSKGEVVEECMKIAGDEVRKHSLNPERTRENQT